MVNIEIRLIIFFEAKDEEALYLAKTRPGADCGSDHKLLIAKFRLKLKKVGETTRPFKHDLSQVPYNGSDRYSQFSSVALSCPTLCNPMDCSTPGFPVHHQLPELAQTYVR